MGGRSAKQRAPLPSDTLRLPRAVAQPWRPKPIDTELVTAVGASSCTSTASASYTEHLSWCGDDGMLYDLFPIPCTGEAVRHTAARIRQVQEMLGRRIAIENASYYVALPGAELSETGGIRAVLEEADCDLHLDRGTTSMNSRNHGF